MKVSFQSVVCIGDSWGFFTCECTSYVAYRLRLNDVCLERDNNGACVNGSNGFFANYWGSSPTVRWGYAYEWGDDEKLDTVGVYKDQYPAVGSVAYWDTKKIPGTGHVAYVQHLFTNKVSGKLDAIGIMEYNWADCEDCDPDHKYRYRKIYPGRGTGYGKGSSWPTAFLHFEEKGRDADNTNVTCVTDLDKGTYRPNGAHDGTFCWKHSSNTNVSCESASNRYYFDYQTCTRYSVGSSYCDGVTDDLPGYTAKLTNDADFPRPIDPKAEKTDFAFCDGSTGSAQGNSNLISGRTPQERIIFWRDIINN